MLKLQHKNYHDKFVFAKKNGLIFIIKNKQNMLSGNFSFNAYVIIKKYTNIQKTL